MYGGSTRRIIHLTIVLAAMHSGLASRQMKDFVAAAVGRRYRNGIYRVFYCVQSLVMFGWAAVWFFRLPDRTLLRIPRPWSWLMRVGQGLSLLLVWQSGRAIGFRRAFGLAALSELRSGGIPEPEPEAQGPALDQNGRLHVAGPFRYTRHGPNLAIFGVVWLQPTITVNWLTAAVMASIYAVIGSLHEESRLRRAYGAQYLRYQQRVPFLFPRIRIPPSMGPATVKDDEGSPSGPE